MDSEPSDPDNSDDVTAPKSKSGKSKKPKKGKKPKLGDKIAGDDDIPFGDDSEEGDVPSDDPEDGPGLKDKKQPRKKRPKHPSKHDQDEYPEDVSFIIPLLTINFIYRYIFASLLILSVVYIRTSQTLPHHFYNIIIKLHV